MNSSPGSKIIVALDLPTGKAALGVVEQIRPDISFFKIGLQLYTAAGPEVVRADRATGAKVFLDLKLHDIPNTVAGAVESASELGVQMLTIHLSGGRAMADAAVRARREGLMILGVTVLTSTDDQGLNETGIPDKVESHVLRLAGIGAAAGVDGLVASPREVKRLREQLGEKMKLVVPGVRPSWAGAGDQKRVMTPRETLAAGADYLVIGRPITAQADPREAVRKILGELAG
jgi:orotidine-5'-phosphate decarboxylase